MNDLEREAYNAWLEVAEWERVQETVPPQLWESMKYKMQTKIFKMTDTELKERTRILKSTAQSYFIKKMARDL